MILMIYHLQNFFNLKKREEILEKSHGGFWNYPISDLSYIRNSYYPTNSMLAHIRNSMKELIWNYGSSQEILNKKLSYLIGVSSKNIIALSGAAQIYPILRNIFIEKNISIPDITFGEYSRIFPDSLTYNDLFNEGEEQKNVLINQN